MPESNGAGDSLHRRFHSSAYSFSVFPLGLQTSYIFPSTIYCNRLSSANILIVNPFSSHDEYSRQSIITYKIVTAITWLLAVITSIYYTFEKPHEGKYHRRTIWGQNSYHKTPFTMDAVITSIYWCVLRFTLCPAL